MRKFLKFILNIVIYAAIVGAIVYGLPYYLTKKLGTNYPIAAITSGSMWPVLHIGDLVLIQKIAKEDIKVGDIIVWQNAKGLPAGRQGFTIHRVTKLSEKTLVTKGGRQFYGGRASPIRRRAWAHAYAREGSSADSVYGIYLGLGGASARELRIMNYEIF